MRANLSQLGKHNPHFAYFLSDQWGDPLFSMLVGIGQGNQKNRAYPNMVSIDVRLIGLLYEKCGIRYFVYFWYINS